MLAITAIVLLLGVRTVTAETHSLTYIYTAFTRPVDLPGIHKFSAMGLLDGRAIDYYDSSNMRKVPMETWMEKRMEKDYWEKGTSSRQTKQQWFKVNLDILTKRLRKNDTDNHFLQWRHGCKLSEGPKKTTTGMDTYSYDGEDFLHFDSTYKQWVAPMDEAEQTKRKWDAIQQLNDYTDGYLHNECVQWLEKFLKYRNDANKNSSPPDVYVYAKPSSTYLKLSCMATGFYPKEIHLTIMRDGQPLDRSDGVESTGVRPNGDGTHQIKAWVKIPKNDEANYTCEVIHPATNINVIREWDHQVEPDSFDTGVTGVGGGGGGGVGVSVSVGVGAGVGVLLFVLVGIITVVALILRRRMNARQNELTQQPRHLVEVAAILPEPKVSGQHGEQKPLIDEPAQHENDDSGNSSGSNSTLASSSSNEV